MPLSRPRRAAAVVTSFLLAVSGTLALAGSSQAAPSDFTAPPAPHRAAGAHVVAERSLASVRSMFTQHSVQQVSSAHPNRDATLVLRDLSLHRSHLSGADRTAADAYLARPTDGKRDPVNEGYTTKEAKPVCSRTICVHYVRSTRDAPSLKDKNHDGVPDYVAKTLSVVQHIHDSYIKAGYRSPKSDGHTGGGNGIIDIYLKDVGNQGLYGYCTSDDPSRSTKRFDRSAYCVFDNDFSPSQFGDRNTAVENLEVTAAHEYFHATQFAYDYYEDSWLLEATATWAEDQMYDNVNDNLQYLADSALTNPLEPVDSFDKYGYQYGTWSFIRFMTEKYTKKQGKLPILVRQIFEKADSAPGGKDDYSWQAINDALKEHHTTAAKMFEGYVTANLRARQTYDEGKANHYPQTPTIKSTLSASKTSDGASGTLDHLSSITMKFLPKGLSKSTTKLRLALNLASLTHGTAGTYTVVKKSGKVVTGPMKLDKSGDGTRTVPFSTKDVSYVLLTAINASGRFTGCFKGGAYSCQGHSQDDGLATVLGATVVS